MPAAYCVTGVCELGMKTVEVVKKVTLAQPTVSKPSGFERKENPRKASFEPYGARKPIIQWTSPTSSVEGQQPHKIEPLR